MNGKSSCFFQLQQLLKEWKIPVYSYTLPPFWDKEMNDDNVDTILACNLFWSMMCSKDDWKEWISMEWVWNWFRQRIPCNIENPTCFLIRIPSFKPHVKPSIMLKVLQVFEKYYHQPGLIVIPMFTGSFYMEDMDQLIGQTNFQLFDLPLALLRPSDVKAMYMERCEKLGLEERKKHWTDYSFQLIRISVQYKMFLNVCHEAIIKDGKGFRSEMKFQHNQGICLENVLKTEEFKDLVFSCNSWKGSRHENDILKLIRANNVVHTKGESV